MIPKKLIDEINRWIDQKKYGNIQINFSGGKIINIKRTDGIKLSYEDFDVCDYKNDFRNNP